MVNGAEYMIKKRDGFALSQAFDQIEHWLKIHFANEEMIARAVEFPFAKNNLEHEGLLKTFYLMRDVIVGKDGAWDEAAAEHYAEFLSDWLTGHVIMEDMLMKPVLQTYPYDFKPAGWHPELAQTEVNRQMAERGANLILEDSETVKEITAGRRAGITLDSA